MVKEEKMQVKLALGLCPKPQDLSLWFSKRCKKI
jgi:hypothetical protein